MQIRDLKLVVTLEVPDGTFDSEIDAALVTKDLSGGGPKRPFWTRLQEQVRDLLPAGAVVDEWEFEVRVTDLDTGVGSKFPHVEAGP